jgi:hypothetical protein
MSHDFWVSVSGDREPLFREIFGDNRVPIESPVGEYAALPGLSGPQYVYKLALGEITRKQRANVVAHLARAFGYAEAEVERDLDAVGMPILARDASVIVHNPQRWLNDDLPLPTNLDGGEDDRYRDDDEEPRFDDAEWDDDDIEGDDDDG